jgi:hypothetical protein
MRAGSRTRRGRRRPVPVMAAARHGAAPTASWSTSSCSTTTNPAAPSPGASTSPGSSTPRRRRLAASTDAVAFHAGSGDGSRDRPPRRISQAEPGPGPSRGGGRLCALLQVIALGHEVGRPVSQIALLALKPKGTGSRSRNSTPLSRITSICARAVKDLALAWASLLVCTAAPAGRSVRRRRLGEAHGREFAARYPRGVNARRSSGTPWRGRRQGAPLDQRNACRLPQRATLRPIFAPSVSANRKWTPDQMRASTMSSRSCEKLVNCRVTPPGVVPLNFARSRP